MADNSMTFSNTLMQLGGEDFLRELTGFMLNLIMEADVTQRINAEPHERSDEHETYRNGYRDRHYNTRLGTLLAPQILSTRWRYRSATTSTKGTREMPATVCHEVHLHKTW